ncbi:MAG: type IV pilus assembly protein FimV, partial [Ramlibacter sp.]
MSVPSFDAQALALGRVTVQSSLGEPLRADIELPEITADEAASLRASIASPAAFQTQGMEFNSALSGVQVSLQRRSDGRYFLRLTGDRPVNEPFVDVVLETTWSSGRIVRDFTMLFDPPALRQGQQPLTAQASPIAPAASPESRAVAPQARGSRSAAAATPAAPAARPAASAAAPAARAAASAPATAAAPAPKGEGK